MVLLEKTNSNRIGVADRMTSQEKALAKAREAAAEAEADKELPPPPGGSHADDAPPLYEEFTLGSSADGIIIQVPDEHDGRTVLSSESSVSESPRTSVAFPQHVVVPTTPAGRSSTALPSTFQPPPSLRSRSTPGSAPASPDPHHSNSLPINIPLTPPPPLGGHSRTHSSSSLHLATFNNAPDRALLTPPSDLKYSRSTSSLVTLAPSLALAEKASPWIPGSRKKAAKQAKVDIHETLRSLISNTPQDAPGVIPELALHALNCKLTLSSVLQEPDPLMQHRSPVYWAVAKLGLGASHEAYVCARTILAAAAPLAASAMSEVRAATLVAGHQSAWEAVRQWVVPLGSNDEMLLGDSGRVDSVEVVPAPDGDDAFTASFEIPLFRKRIKLGGRVTFDFFAKGRIFCVTILEVPSTGLPKRKGRPTDKASKRETPEVGSWVVQVGMYEPSPTTPICARLFVEHSPHSRVAGMEAAAYAPVDLIMFPPKGWTLGDEDDPKKKISDEIWAGVRESELGRALEAEDSPYLDADGTLRGRLGIKLAEMTFEETQSGKCIIM